MSYFDITGGPAYPTPDTENANGDVMYGDSGMTLLDYFAGQAMQTLIGLDPCGGVARHVLSDPAVRSIRDWIADDAYEQAQAMLRARAKILEAIHD